MKILPKNLETASIRIDFFSKPLFNERFIEMLKDSELDKLRFFNRFLTEEEQQRIDIDNVAQNLSVSIEEILCGKACIYMGTNDSGLNVEAYLTDYFICLYFEKIKEENVHELRKISKEILDRIMLIDNEINAQDFSFRISSHLQADYEAMNSILNHELIRIPDNDRFTNARYADLYIMDNGIKVNLIRDVIKGMSGDNEIFYDVLISAIANKSIGNDNLREIDFNYMMDLMGDLNIDKIDMCYV